MRLRTALCAAMCLAVVFTAGCSDDGVSITEQARNDLDGRLDAIGLAIAAGRADQAGEALDELVSQAERYAEDGQMDPERLTAILDAADELSEQLGGVVPPSTTTTEFQPPPTTVLTEDEGDQGGEGQGNGNGGGNGNGNGNGIGQGSGEDRRRLRGLAVRRPQAPVRRAAPARPRSSPTAGS